MKPYEMNGLIYHNTHSALCFLLEKIVLEVVLQICYVEVLQENIESGCGLEASVELTLPRATLAY